MSPKQLTSEDAKVLVSLRMPLRYRNQLARIATDTRTSLNYLLLEAIEKEYPPDDADRGD